MVGPELQEQIEQMYAVAHWMTEDSHLILYLLTKRRARPYSKHLSRQNVHLKSKSQLMHLCFEPSIIHYRL
jgi:hypothetical protein